jgi:hypothetical protein
MNFKHTNIEFSSKYCVSLIQHSCVCFSVVTYYDFTFITSELDLGSAALSINLCLF